MDGDYINGEHVSTVSSEGGGPGDSILLHTDTGEDGIEMVLASHDGEPLGKFLLPGVDEVQHFTGDRLYTIHRSPELGHSVRLYELLL